MASKTPSTSTVLEGSADPSKMAVVMRISEADIRSIERAGSLQFVTGGPDPMFTFGGQSLNLTLSPEKFTRELYHAQDSHSFKLISHIACRAKIMRPLNKQEAQDPALLALTNELAAYKKEKEASQTHLANAFLPIPKNRREAAQQQRRGGFLAASKQLGPSSPSLSASQTSARAPTSAPVDNTARRTRAMRTALIHFLAKGDATIEEIVKVTHIPDNDTKELLKILAQPVDRKWKLSDKSFRELDPWRFKYLLEDDRKAAIDNAIRAYDRMRLSKDDKLWQVLLPKNERGHGKVLSRLHLGTASQQSSTPRVGSPMVQPDTHQSSAVNTPQQASSGTPKLTAKKTGGDVMKRLLSKDPKKARAVEEAKEKKRKERENQDTAADARPAKRQAVANTKSSNANVKSEEFVHSSDDDEVNGGLAGKRVTSKSTSHAPSHSNTTTQHSVKTSSIRKTDTSSAVSTARPNAGRLTPQLQQKGSNAKSRAHISPPKPTVPSPLGAARPRVTSDVSDRSGITHHKRNNTAEGPRGLGITTTPVRKRHDTITSMESNEDIRSQLKKDEAMLPTSDVTKRKATEASTISSSQQNSRKSSASNTVRTQSSEDRFDGGTSDSSASIVMDNITFSQGVEQAHKFKTEYYPQYAKLYDAIADQRHRGEPVASADWDKLYEMQARLEQMKREIEVASARKSSGNSS